MPFTWKLVIALQAVSFLVAAFSTRHYRLPWLSGYFTLASGATIVWWFEDWQFSILIRPLFLALQALAIIEAVERMHADCVERLKRFRLGLCCAVVAVSGTFAAVEYPGFPRVLFWAQLWLNVLGFIACPTVIAVYAWWRSFRPPWWKISNVGLWGLFCGVHLAGMLSARLTNFEWVRADTWGAVARIACVLAWAVVLSSYTAGMSRRA